MTNQYSISNYNILGQTAGIIDMPNAISYPDCDFKSMFNDHNFEEIHNHHSMNILGNSLNVLKQMKNQSVNLIFADAPYGIGKDLGFDSGLERSEYVPTDVDTYDVPHNIDWSS